MDIYKEVTDRIIAEMETGLIPWQKPWVASGGCVSYATGKPYSLLQIFHSPCHIGLIAQQDLRRPGKTAELGNMIKYTVIIVTDLHDMESPLMSK